MELSFTLTLPDLLYHELIEGCRECECSPKQFAAESVLSVLAARRLSRVPVGAHGARVVTAIEEDAEPEGYPVHWPEGISGT